MTSMDGMGCVPAWGGLEVADSSRQWERGVFGSDNFLDDT